MIRIESIFIEDKPHLGHKSNINKFKEKLIQIALSNYKWIMYNPLIYLLKSIYLALLILQILSKDNKN